MLRSRGQEKFKFMALCTWKYRPRAAAAQCCVLLCCGAVSPAEGGDLLLKQPFFYCFTSVNEKFKSFLN